MKFTLITTTGIFATLLSTGLAIDSFASDTAAAHTTAADASRSLSGTGAGITTVVTSGAFRGSLHTDTVEKDAGTTTDGKIDRGLGEKANGQDPDGQGCKFCCGQGCRF
jgi:hypothetical protein